MKDTRVVCASGKVLEKLKNEKQMAYYWADIQMITIDCDRYENEKATDGATINIAHEYFRAINVEGKTYEYFKLVAEGIKNLGLVKIEKGSFEGYQTLFKKYYQATGINEENTLGVISEFTCTIVDPDNSFSTKDYIFKKKGRGVFEHYKNRSACNLLVCTAYEFQSFILDEYSQLKSSSIFTYETVSRKEYDRSQLTFRQAKDGSLIGIRTREETGIMFWKQTVEKVYSMLSCYRKSLSAE